MTLREPGRRTLPRAATFWILATLFLMMFFASAAASPLYRVYQARFHFSAATLTAVFAVYVLVLLATLLFFGSVSDYLGRLPVIIAATFGAIAATASAAFLAGTAVAGAGFGLAFLGSFRTITALAEPDDRAGLVAAIYIAGYLAFSVPALIAGVAATRFGLHSTALVYAAALAALASAAVGLLLLHPGARDAQPTPAVRAVMPPGRARPHRARRP
jgi:MFS family permease